MTAIVNKSMDRDDLLTDSGQAFVAELDALNTELDRRRLPVTSWYGSLRTDRVDLSARGMKNLAKRALGRVQARGVIGEDNRGGPRYEAIPGVKDDDRHPWFLFWEAYWAMRVGPRLRPEHRVLDAGGTASLFSCYLASRGAEVHSIDLNETLVAAGRTTADAMGWNLRSYSMNMEHLEFEDASLDHAYSICVFEHLHFDLRQRALAEIARVLKPGGILSITFDYRGSSVALAGQGHDTTPRNLIRSPEDVKRNFMSTEAFEVVGNAEFHDNGKSYLVGPPPGSTPYTFGAVFLRKVT